MQALHRDVQAYILTYLSKIDLQIINCYSLQKNTIYSNDYNSYIFSYAAKCGYANILQLYDIRELNHFLLKSIIHHEHLDVLKLYLLSFTLEQRTAIFRIAANYGHLDIMIWIHEMGCDVDIFICTHAIRHLNVIKWLYNKNIIKHAEICNVAICNGQLDALQWMSNNEIIRLSAMHNLCETAARYGQLNILKWLRNQGYSWGVWVCRYSAGNGYIDILQYAIKNGCPYDDAKYYAIKNGHSDIVAWMTENGY